MGDDSWFHTVLTSVGLEFFVVFGHRKAHCWEMASVYKRPGSRFWWLKYRDAGTGKIVRRSTGIDLDAPDGRRRAKAEQAKFTHKEMAAPKTKEAERWEAWVDAFFTARYSGRGSLKNAKKAVLDLLSFFAEKEIRTPRQVTYDIAASFVPWRISNVTLDKVGQNTARLRFVYFRILMSEAVRRGYADFNPCREVLNRKAPAKEKQEISAADQAKIEAKLLEKKEWMRDQWLVLMRQGCRIAETAVPLDRIDTKAMTITFKLKGGRMHTAALHPDLLPLIEKATKENRETLIDGPPAGSWSATWSTFFSSLGLPYSIHCTRVTVITRLIRAGASVASVCAFIGHTEAVNRIYRKLKPSDSASLLDILAGAPTPS